VSAQEPGGEAITAQGLEDLRAELHELETTARQAIAKRISFAREMGDLKENAEYHIAKEDQAHLETKIQRLQSRLRNAVVVEADTTTGVVAFGTTAHVVDQETGKSFSWTIVGPTEADLATGRLSAESPVARALIGRAPGDEVTVETPRGDRTYRVEQVGL
jgi:transcription elongation factor GreA